MPRVSPEHERAVRDRIVRAATVVFAEHGFHRATMQDIVHASGLSVGAIYTYFRSKSELILAGCDLIADLELGELRRRLDGVVDYRERIGTALGFFFDQFEAERLESGQVGLLTHAWAETDTDPAIREMLRRRRREVVTSCALLLQEGVVRGELPAWIDVDAVAHGVAALLDGTVLAATEEGPAYRRADAERHALSLLEPLFAAAAAERPAPIEPVPPKRYESIRETAPAPASARAS
jgi:AcrR family transcriptional regulator